MTPSKLIPYIKVRGGHTVSWWKKSTTAAAFREEIRKRIILTVEEEVSRKSTDPTNQLERGKMRRNSIKMRQRLCRYETDLAVFGGVTRRAGGGRSTDRDVRRGEKEN